MNSFKRYPHRCRPSAGAYKGVMETAVILADRFGADPVKAELAAILHDVAKYWPVQKLHQMMVEHALSEELLRYDKQLWHAEVGAFVAEHEYGVTDTDVLNAIRYHTSGRVGMTRLIRWSALRIIWNRDGISPA